MMQIQKICIVSLAFMLLQPISVFADEAKNIPNKIGNQLSSEAQSEAVSAIFDSLEKLNCQNDPNSRACLQTKQNITVATGGLGIIGVIGSLGFGLWIIKQFQ